MIKRIKKLLAVILCTLVTIIPAFSNGLAPVVMAEASAGDVLLEKSTTYKYSQNDTTLYMWSTYDVAGAQYGWFQVKSENGHVHVFYNTTDNYIWIVSAEPNTVIGGAGVASGSDTRTLTDTIVIQGITFYYYKLNASCERVYSLDVNKLDSKIPKVASLEAALSLGDIDYIDKNGADVVVSASVEAGYTVKLPAIFELTYNDSTRRFEYNYTVSVKGVVDDNKALAVVPNSSVTLYKADKSDSVTATVSQPKAYWVNSITNSDTQTLIDYGSFSDSTGVCYLNSVKSGNWAGTLHFTFSIVDQ